MNENACKCGSRITYSQKASTFAIIKKLFLITEKSFKNDLRIGLQKLSCDNIDQSARREKR